MLLRRVVIATLGVLFLTVVGCGGDAVTTPALTYKLKIVNGDGQTGESYGTLPVPLEIELTSTDGRPLAGSQVTWTIPKTTAPVYDPLTGTWVTPPGSTTSEIPAVIDKDGHAAISFRVGRSGQYSVGATAGDLHVTFTESAVVPTKGVVLHYDGNAWRAVVQDTGAAGTIAYTISGSSASDIVFGGQSCQSAMFLHYTGGEWPDPSPNCYVPPGSVDALYGIGVISSSDMWTSMRHPGVSAEWIGHYNGQTWDGSYHLGGLAKFWVSSAKSVYAMTGARLVHFDGTSWSDTYMPGVGMSSVWADKQSGSTFTVGKDGGILYYDGSTWQTQTSGTTQQLNGVSGTSPSDVFAVGAAGTILHYDGTSWLPQQSGTMKNLTAVWATASNSVFALGDNTILHFDGTNWSAQTFPGPMYFMAIWAASPTDVYAVGTGWAF
jgi:hypothetical protein